VRALALAALALVAGSCSSSPPAATGPVTAAPSATRQLPEAVDISRTAAAAISAAPAPDFIVLGKSYAFVSNVGKGVGRFDLPTGALVDSVEIPGETCEALDVGFGAVWTATCARAALARIEEESGRVTLIDLPDRIAEQEASLGAGEGAVWIVVGADSRRLVRVDPATNAVSGTFAMPAGATAVRAGVGAVWVTVPQKNTLLRVDPADGRVRAEIHVGAGPQFLAVGEGAVWVMNQLDGTISRVAPSTNSVVATIHFGERINGGDIAVGAGSVWVRGSATLLARIDPATNTITNRYGPRVGSGSVAADNDAVWITAHDVKTIWRLPLP
jgi:virginiamycin B lyase